MSTARARFLLTVALIASLVLSVSSTAVAVTANEAFDNVWATTDQAVANGTATYSWFWGPTVLDQRFEPYEDSPGGQREVRYYDKSRMEINDPAGDPNNIYYVTNGLLTVELVTGRIKTGDAPNAFEQRQPATELVAGDPQNNPGTPAYATFADHVTIDGQTNRATDQTGQAVTAFMSGSGEVSATDSRGVSLAHYENVTGHNIASVFWDWFNSPTSGFRPDVGVNWVYVAGLPISEPYWIDATVGGNQRRVLVQLFERRVLTYTDSNQDPYRIEWGNIGRHSHTWHDAVVGPAACPDSPEGVYLYVADNLNDRIQKFDAEGDFICEWFGDYDLDGPSARPHAIAVDSQNNVWVNALTRIEKFDRQGRFLGYWDPGVNAWDMVFDSQDNLYITDVETSSVLKFDTSGNLLDQWGGQGAGDGQFSSPTGIAIDAQDNVYVADYDNKRIQKFTSNGDYIDQWVGSEQNGDLWGFPGSVAVDDTGVSYVTSIRIFKFSAEGAQVDVFGEPGDVLGTGDIAVAADGTIYAVEDITTMINRYDSTGALLDSWGGSGSAQGQFSSVAGIAASTQ